MSAANPKIGRGPCPSCGEEVHFRRTPAGKVTYQCFGCDSAGYADPGGQAQAKWTGSITRPAPAAPTPPGPPPPPVPPTAKKAGSWLGEL